MKKSNIIIVSLTASITLLITTGMMEVRIKGKTREPFADRFVKIRPVSIPEFHYVVVADCRNVSLSVSDAFTIGMAEQSGVAPTRNYSVKNDTLYIEGLPLGEQRDMVAVTAPAEQVRSVRALHAQIVVSNLSLDKFVIHANESQISINTEQSINNLVVEGRRQSMVDFHNPSHIHTLDLDLDQTGFFNSGADADKLTGSIRNQSRVQLNNAEEVVFNKDATSHLQIWGN